MKQLHIEIDDETVNILEHLKKTKNFSYTKTIHDSVRLTYNYNNIYNELQNISKLLNNIYGKEFLIIDLIKQLYSDLEIENHTDYSKNQSLKQFFDDRRISKDD